MGRPHASEDRMPEQTTSLGIDHMHGYTRYNTAWLGIPYAWADHKLGKTTCLGIPHACVDHKPAGRSHASVDRLLGYTTCLGRPQASVDPIPG